MFFRGFKCDKVELEHVLAYTSGEIDGDGGIKKNIGKTSKSPFNLLIQFLGTPMLLNWFKEKFDSLIPTNTRSQVTKRKDANLYYYYAVGTKAYLLSKMILSLDIPRLERKWGIAREYINLVENTDISVEMKCKLKRMLSPQIIQFVESNGGSFPEHIKNLALKQ